MNKMKKVLALMLAFVMTVSVLTVTPSTTVEAAPSKYVKSLKVSKKKLTLEANAKASINATVKVTGTTSKSYKKVKVSLTAANKKVVKVKVGKPNAKGVSKITFTAKNVDKKTTTKVKVQTAKKNKKNKKVSQTVTITVNPKTTPTTEPVVVPEVPATTEAPVIEATNVTATAAKSTINVGEATVVTANVLPENAQDKSVTYTSSNPSVATVTENGVVTGISAGHASITVTTKNGKVAIVTIAVMDAEITNITLDKTSVDLFVSGTTTLTETITPASASAKEITWTTSDAAVATVKDGVVTAIGVGTATITATTKNGLTAECVVTVSSKTALADGLTMEMTNPYIDINGKEYANTALVGDDMTIQTRVVKDGQPVGNINVSLSIDTEYSYGDILDAYEIVDNAVTTDSNGYANFTISLKKDYTYNAISGHYQSLVLNAKESGSNTEQSLTVKFGTIQLNGISVLNDGYILPEIVPSDNASATDDGLHTTYYLNEDMKEEFVSSQRVSAEDGTDAHEVYFSASPYLILPATKENAHIGNWEYVLADENVNGTSGPCSVYNDATNETTTVQIASIPAGLNFITLHFDKISLSKYTTMNIDVYDALTGEHISGKQVTTIEQDSKGIQVPIQEDINSYLVVSLVSQGQVDTTNEGYVLTKLVGNWASHNNELTYIEEIEGSVKWSNVTSEVIYETKKWSYDEAVDYLPADSTFLNENYQYTYKVPVFPYTGNAIIDVKDAKGEHVAYYIYPTQNDGTNVNVLAAASTSVKAIQASDEEVSDSVGTLTTIGNTAVVDSTKAGMTALKAEIKVAGLDSKELNEQNGGILYTSVQWSPVPEQKVMKVFPDFFAIEGQDVVVKAQLFDKNGNKKTDSGTKVTFKLFDVKTEEETEIDLTGTAVGSRATLANVSNSGSTDSTGTVTLTIRDLTNNEYYSLVEGLTAEAEGYTVKLSVGGEDYVEAADIYWVDLGLTFVNSAVADDNPVRTTQFENSALAIKDAAEYIVSDSNGWQIGYKVVARSSKFPYPFYDEAEFTNPVLSTYLTNAFVDVSGISVIYEKNSEDVTLSQNNSVAILDTTVAGSAVLTGELRAEDVSAVKFTFLDDEGNKVTYNNIGEGTPNIEETGLKLTTNWSTDGANVELIAPKNVYNQTAATVYVVVKDDYENPIANADVEYTISGVNETAGTGKTNAKGVLAISLDPVSVTTTAVAVVSVKVNNSIPANVNINYVPAAADISAFTLREETDTKYAVVIGDDKQTINIYFSNAVNTEMINAGQFTFVQDGSTDNTYKVVSAVKGSESTCVTIKLDKPIASEGAPHTLKIASYTDSLGVVYTLIDSYGQVFSDTSYAITPSERE